MRRAALLLPALAAAARPTERRYALAVDSGAEIHGAAHLRTSSAEPATQEAALLQVLDLPTPSPTPKVEPWAAAAVVVLKTCPDGDEECVLVQVRAGVNSTNATDMSTDAAAEEAEKVALTTAKEAGRAAVAKAEAGWKAAVEKAETEGKASIPAAEESGKATVAKAEEYLKAEVAKAQAAGQELIAEAQAKANATVEKAKLDAQKAIAQEMVRAQTAVAQSVQYRGEETRAEATEHAQEALDRVKEQTEADIARAEANGRYNVQEAAEAARDLVSKAEKGGNDAVDKAGQYHKEAVAKAKEDWKAAVAQAEQEGQDAVAEAEKEGRAALKEAEEAHDLSKRWDGRFGLVGGHTEHADRSPVETVVRECQEESGLELSATALHEMPEATIVKADGRRVEFFMVDLDHSPAPEGLATHEHEMDSAETFLEKYGATAGPFGHMWLPLRNLNLLRNAANGVVPDALAHIELAMNYTHELHPDVHLTKAGEESPEAALNISAAKDDVTLDDLREKPNETSTKSHDTADGHDESMEGEPANATTTESPLQRVLEDDTATAGTPPPDPTDDPVDEEGNPIPSHKASNSSKTSSFLASSLAQMGLSYLGRAPW